MELSLYRITDPASVHYHSMIELYCEAFPEQERRSVGELEKNLIKDVRFWSYAILKSGFFVGFINYWKLKDFNYVEHLAMTKESRGKGYGTRLFSEHIIPRLSPLILEVEFPVTQQAEKRIDFYKRIGFHVCDVDYIQPPYDANKPEVPLLLMTYPSVYLAEKIRDCITEIHRVVYQVGKDMGK